MDQGRGANDQVATAVRHEPERYSEFACRYGYEPEH
jgi:hypothetical protein